MSLVDDLLDRIKRSIVNMEDQQAVEFTRKALEIHPAEDNTEPGADSGDGNGRE